MQAPAFAKNWLRSGYTITSGWIVALAFLLLLPASLQATPLGVAGDYNVFIFGDVNQRYTDTQGGVAVGGNASYEHMSVASHVYESLPHGDLVVGGDLDWSHGSVGWLNPSTPDSSDSKNGSIVVGGTAKIGLDKDGYETVTYGSMTSGMPIDFVSEQQRLQSLSNYWGNLSPNGTTSILFDGDEIHLDGADPLLNIFSLDGAMLQQDLGFHINVPETATTLVNVSGLSSNLQNFGFFFNGAEGNNNPDFPDTSILYNFFEADALTIAGIEIHGSILAPFADILFYDGHIDGNLIARALEGDGEAHNELFDGDLPTPPAVPEPATIVLLGMGLIGAAIASKRNQSS